MGEGGVYKLAWGTVGTLREAGEKGGGVSGGEGEEEREVARGFHGSFWEGWEGCADGEKVQMRRITEERQ